MITIKKTVRLVAAPEPPFVGTKIDILVPGDSRTFGIGSIYIADDASEFSIDWGDGCEPLRFSENASLVTHEYAAGGRYSVRISDGARSISISTSKTPGEYVTVYAPMIERVVSTAEKLTTIGSRAFKDCTALTFASFKSVSVLPAPNASNVQFIGCEALAAIHFAAENEEAIKATTGWARSEGTLGAANATIYFDL